MITKCGIHIGTPPPSFLVVSHEYKNSLSLCDHKRKQISFQGGAGMEMSKTNIVTKQCPYCKRWFYVYWDVGFVIHKEWCKKKNANKNSK